MLTKIQDFINLCTQMNGIENQNVDRQTDIINS